MKKKRWRRAWLGVVLALAALSGFSGGAEARRAVTVNGHWLTPPQIAQADRNAGFVLPSGHYWCDPRSGYWGPLGQGAWGRVHPSQCPPPAGGGGGAYLRRGPGGTIGGSGGCSYYNDPETGASVMTGNC